jgi:Pyruvate/2-oxoacid:ferredoxin oxidoreductase delta subunit
MSDVYTCHICKTDMEEDDVVWADKKGNVEVHHYAYCVGCLPPQKESYE